MTNDAKGLMNLNVAEKHFPLALFNTCFWTSAKWEFLIFVPGWIINMVATQNYMTAHMKKKDFTISFFLFSLPKYLEIMM